MFTEAKSTVETVKFHKIVGYIFMKLSTAISNLWKHETYYLDKQDVEMLRYSFGIFLHVITVMMDHLAFHMKLASNELYWLTSTNKMDTLIIYYLCQQCYKQNNVFQKYMPLFRQTRLFVVCLVNLNFCIDMSSR